MSPAQPNSTDPQPSATAPRIRAPDVLRAFRQESELSWDSFNQLWMDISNILNSPSHDILLAPDRSHEAMYAAKLGDLTRDILASGVFGPQSHSRWHHGRHEEEEDMDAIVDFIARLTAHAASGIMTHVMAWDDSYDVRADKVGAWLMNGEATLWDDYVFFNREENGQKELGGDYGCDDSTGVGPSRAVTPTVTRVAETVYPENGGAM